MSELHEQYFERQYQEQMQCVNNSITRDAKRVKINIGKQIVNGC